MMTTRTVGNQFNSFDRNGNDCVMTVPGASEVSIFGVKGMNSTPFSKTFKTETAMAKWIDQQGGNIQILGYSA